MFKLTFSPASPYVRKVLLSAYRAGIQDELELVEAGSENDTLLRGKTLLEKSQYYKNLTEIFYLIVE